MLFDIVDSQSNAMTVRAISAKKDGPVGNKLKYSIMKFKSVSIHKTIY